MAQDNDASRTAGQGEQAGKGPQAAPGQHPAKEGPGARAEQGGSAGQGGQAGQAGKPSGILDKQLTDRSKGFNKERFSVYLRALEPGDAETTHKWRNDETYRRGVTSTTRYVSLDTERRWIDQAIRDHENLKHVRFGLCLKRNDELIGMMQILDIDMVNRNAAFGIMIGGDKHRGIGYVIEAGYLLFEYCFIELGLERISARVLEGNRSSRRMLEKFGFVNEGLLRNAVYKGGGFQNMVQYSALREQFMEQYEVDMARVARERRADGQ